MVRFLSDAWIDAMDAAIRDDDQVRDTAAGTTLAIAQVVTEAPGGEVGYTVELEDGSARVRRGTEGAQVTFTQDHATAVAIARGELAAQAAFIDGRLEVRGDLQVLLTHVSLLAELDEAFSRTRARTTF
jgi:predicted lipid carrier protein YhbT